MSPNDRISISITDYSFMTDAQIAASIRDNLSSARYAHSMQNEGVLLSISDDFIGVALRNNPITALATAIGIGSTEVMDGLPEEIAGTLGLEAVSLENISNASFVLGARNDSYPFGGYSVNTNTSYGSNYNGIVTDDSQGSFINYLGVEIVNRPTIQDDIDALRVRTTATPHVYPQTDPDDKLGIVIGTPSTGSSPQVTSRLSFPQQGTMVDTVPIMGTWVDPAVVTTPPPPLPTVGVVPVVQPVPVATMITSLSQLYPGQTIQPDFSIMADLAPSVFHTTVPYVSSLAPTSSPRPPQGRTTYNETGYVASWHGAPTAANSVYSQYTLDHYNGHVSSTGYAQISFMDHLSLIGDLLTGRVRYSDVFHRVETEQVELSLEERGLIEGQNYWGNDDAGEVDDSPFAYADVMPIILDLDGNGIRITDLSQSTTFIDGGDGLEHRTAWAGAGDAVLFYDPDNTGEITEMRQYVFTEWDPTATSDMAALASVFDTNGDGELSGAELGDFHIMETNADGTTTSHTLTELGITSINLTADATHIELPDGSTGKVANSIAKCWECRMLRVHAA